MKRPTRRHPVAVALYVNAAVLVAILVVLLGRDSSRPMLPAAFGQAAASPGVAGGAGVFVMPAQFSQSVWGCYVMDVEQQTLCAYTVSGTPPKLRLVAARDIRHDRRLRSYNLDGPSPSEVQDLIAKEASNGRVVDRPAPQPISPEKQ